MLKRAIMEHVQMFGWPDLFLSFFFGVVVFLLFALASTLLIFSIWWIITNLNW